MCSRLVVAAILFSATPAVLAAQHTHGVATLDIAIDDRTVTLRLVASADDIYGFERAPRTDAERAARHAGLETLRTDVTTLFAFDRALGCTPSTPIVTDAPPPSGSRHREVVAEYAFRCQRSPRGSRVPLGVWARLPELTSIKVTLLLGDDVAVRTLTRGQVLTF